MPLAFSPHRPDAPNEVDQHGGAHLGHHGFINRTPLRPGLSRGAQPSRDSDATRGPASIVAKPGARAVGSSGLPNHGVCRLPRPAGHHCARPNVGLWLEWGGVDPTGVLRNLPPFQPCWSAPRTPSLNAKVHSQPPLLPSLQAAKSSQDELLPSRAPTQRPHHG